MTAQSPTKTMKRRVLVVDDSITLRELLKNTLEAFGYEVVGVAADGREAVELVEILEPDAVLLDIDMPEYDGIWALERIARNRPALVVIMLTGHREDGIIKRCSDLGARGFLHKPFQMDRLHDEIRLLLSVAHHEEVRAELTSDYYDYIVKPRVSLPHKVGVGGDDGGDEPI